MFTRQITIGVQLNLQGLYFIIKIILKIITIYNNSNTLKDQQFMRIEYYYTCIIKIIHLDLVIVKNVIS